MDCGKKAVKKRTVVEEERAKLFRDSEDTMAVSAGKSGCGSERERTSILRSGDSGTLRRRKKGHRSESSFQHSQ